MEKELDSIAILVKMETPLLSGSYQIEVIGFRKRFSKTKYQKEKRLKLHWRQGVTLS